MVIWCRREGVLKRGLVTDGRYISDTRKKKRKAGGRVQTEYDEMLCSLLFVSLARIPKQISKTWPAIPYIVLKIGRDARQVDVLICNVLLVEHCIRQFPPQAIYPGS